MALPSIIQAGSKLDFVHVNGISDSVNQALKENVGDFDYLAYLVDH